MLVKHRKKVLKDFYFLWIYKFIWIYNFLWIYKYEFGSAFSVLEQEQEQLQLEVSPSTDTHKLEKGLWDPQFKLRPYYSFFIWSEGWWYLHLKLDPKDKEPQGGDVIFVYFTQCLWRRGWEEYCSTWNISIWSYNIGEYNVLWFHDSCFAFSW